LIQRFSLEGVPATNGVFDKPNLELFQPVSAKLPIEICSRIRGELSGHQLWKPEWAAGAAPGPDGHVITPGFRARSVCSARAFAFYPIFFFLVAAFFSDDFRSTAAKDKFWKIPTS